MSAPHVNLHSKDQYIRFAKRSFELAKAAKTPEEASGHRAQGEIWRQLAESRKENGSFENNFSGRRIKSSGTPELD